MATPTIKSTYALDVETVRALEGLARLWNVSKSEALRRAIRGSALTESPGPPAAVQALDQLQAVLGAKPSEAERWSAVVRAQRRASSKRREGPAR